MRKSSRLITQFYEERLSSVGLKAGQFSILRAVHFCKETSNKELQKILVLEQTTLTRNLKPLLRDGFLHLSVDPKDKRVKRITLSSSGKKLYKKALPVWKGAQKELHHKLGKNETVKILSLSKSFVDKLAVG